MPATQNFGRDEIAQEFNSFDFKASCRVATTAAVTLNTAFAAGQSIDGVELATGNRVLIKNQTSGSENGIYTIKIGNKIIDENIIKNTLRTY